jgi:hypothetical protein
VIGPCMCGDPYCPACGGSGYGKEDAEEAIINALDIQTEEEAAFLLAALPHLLDAHRTARAEALAEAERERLAQAAEEAWFESDCPRQEGGAR